MTVQEDKTREQIFINGYRLLCPMTNADAGFSRWAYAEKGGREYFVKEFLSPVCPRDDGVLSKETIARKRNICIKFFQRKQRLYEALNACDNGNIIIIRDFFLFQTKYYCVTEKITAERIDVSKCEWDQRLMIYRVLADSIRQLHDKGIVHADLKPNNVLLKRTRSGMITTKLIDFDSSYLLSEPPDNRMLEGDQTYLSPEGCLAMNDAGPNPTLAADVFSFGLMLHVFETGKQPGFSEKYNYPHEALLDHGGLLISHAIQPELHILLERMLEKDAAKRPPMQDVFGELSHFGYLNPAASARWYTPKL